VDGFSLSNLSCCANRSYGIHATCLRALDAWRSCFLGCFYLRLQDVVIDAYRTDVLYEKERGIGAATFVLGYRVAMLVAGALALIMSDHIGWQNTYLIMAAIMVLAFCTFVGPEPQGDVTPPKTLKEAVWGPLQDFISIDSRCP